MIDRSQDARHSGRPSGGFMPPSCLELALRNPSWQRPCVTATTDRTYERNRFDPHTANSCKQGAVHIWVVAEKRELPASAWPSPATWSQTGHHAGRALSRSRPGADCKSARGHRTRSAFESALAKASLDERDSRLVTAMGTDVKEIVALSETVASPVFAGLDPAIHGSEVHNWQLARMSIATCGVIVGGGRTRISLRSSGLRLLRSLCLLRAN